MAERERYLLGLDAGNTVIKAVLFDLAGRQIARAARDGRSIVSEPGHPRRRFRVSTRYPGDRYLDPDSWAAQAECREGSWWPVWWQWLEEKSVSKKVKPPKMGAPEHGLLPLEPAPGTYIFQR